MSGAVAVTFDNLGEVADLQRGRWPADEPLGYHHSVTQALPHVLELLAEFKLQATFFVEGLNAELYPDALRGIDAAGHEVAYHGWCHEPWSQLHPAREAELLARGRAAFAQLGLSLVGFRPPGGELAPSSIGALTAAGFAYCSPAGEEAGVRDGLVVLPFQWKLIDAFHYLPHFAPRREALLGAPDLLAPAALRRRVAEALARAVHDGAFVSLLFHPFLLDTPERWTVAREILSDVRSLVKSGRIRCAPLREIARRV